MAEGRSKQSMVVWSSLCMDLVRKVGDSLLATSDVVSYLDMRAVCHNWRAAIPKPPPLSGVTDQRFRPREWIMLDEDKPAAGVDGRLFLNASTGRFLLLRVPLLDEDDYILVGASDGLLVLGESKGLHPARLLNPFTGDMLPYVAPIPQENKMLLAVAGSNPTLLFSFDDYSDSTIAYVYCADTTSPLCEVKFKGCFQHGFDLKSLVSYAGHFYMVEYCGVIFKVVGTAPNYQAELIVWSSEDDCDRCFLVESAGELLLVIPEGYRVKVFRVNIERKQLERVRNIGSQALFLGARCLSVDADELPYLDRNCMYYLDDTGVCYRINRYDLSSRKLERLPFAFQHRFVRSNLIRPFSIVQSLLDYCTNIPDVCTCSN